jgi:hypothetical protein
LATTTLTRPKRGRPGREVLPGVPVRNRRIALRNKRIKAAYARKRSPLTQEQIAAKYGVDQSVVSVVIRNPLSTVVRDA